jgi:hypothetical protein
MDPATAAALAFKAACEMVTELIKGQTPEQRAQIWNWFLEDQKFWRQFLPKPKP